MGISLFYLLYEMSFNKDGSSVLKSVTMELYPVFAYLALQSALRLYLPRLTSDMSSDLEEARKPPLFQLDSINRTTMGSSIPEGHQSNHHHSSKRTVIL